MMHVSNAKPKDAVLYYIKNKNRQILKNGCYV